MKFLESIVNMKLNTIRRPELLQLAKQNGIVISPSEADQIVAQLHGKNYNLFNDHQRNIILTKIAQIVGNERARQIEKVFLKLTGR